MATDEVIALLGGWEGYAVGTVERFKAGRFGPTAQVWIELIRHPPDLGRSALVHPCTAFPGNPCPGVSSAAKAFLG